MCAENSVIEDFGMQSGWLAGIDEEETKIGAKKNAPMH
jgi:hypothetical protein